MHSSSQKVNRKIANRIKTLKDQTLELMRTDKIYDQNELFNRIYYNPQKTHHDYRELREAIHQAKNEGI